MREYDVVITETLEKTVAVEAGSREDAEAMVREGWSNSDYILDAENFTGVDFAAGEGRETARDTADKDTMTALLVSPQQHPKTVEVGTSLEALQGAVGGTIQAVYPFADSAALVMNDEGKLLGLPPNRSLRDECGSLYDVIAGDFLVVGLEEDRFCSLSPELLAKFEGLYHQPELFVQMGKGMLAIPMPDDMVKGDGPAPDKSCDLRAKGQARPPGPACERGYDHCRKKLRPRPFT